MRNMNLRSWPDAALFQKLKQAAVTLIDATHLKILSRFGLGQQQ